MDYVEYPKWLYHASQPACVVDGYDAEVALGEGWFPTPDLMPKVVPVPPAPAEPSDLRAEWVEIAGWLKLDVDGRWKLARVKEEVRKAVDVMVAVLTDPPKA